MYLYLNRRSKLLQKPYVILREQPQVIHPVFQHGRERAVKGASHRRLRRPALDRLSRLCFFSGKRRGYILQSRPLSQEWERAWGLG